MKNNEFFANSLPMIASENVLSPMCREMLISDFHGRYAEGTPGHRYYEGCNFFDNVEEKAVWFACLFTKSIVREAVSWFS